MIARSWRGSRRQRDEDFPGSDRARVVEQAMPVRLVSTANASW